MAEALREAVVGMNRSTAVLAPVPAEPPAPEPLVVLEPPVTPEPQPVSETPPLPPTRGIRGPRWLWLGAGVALLAGLALAAFFFQPDSGGGGSQPTPLPTSVVAGPTAAPRPNLKVLANSSVVFDLAALGDVVWAATSGGLARYGADGSTRSFSAADGLPFNATTAIYADPDGWLYLGGNDGVARLRPAGDGLGEVSFYSREQGVDIGQVFAFMTDSDGSVWLGGDDGLRRFDGQKWAAPALPLDDPAVGEIRAVYTMLRDTSGTLWIGVEGGILRWDGQAWTRFGEEQGLGQGLILRMLQAKDGTIWAAGGGLGLLRFDTGQGSWQKVAVSHDGEDVRSINQLADGRLWVTNDAGIFQLAADGTSWEAITPPPDYPGWPGLGRMAEDSAGKIWIAGGAGVSCCANASWQLRELPASLPFGRVGALSIAPDGKLWAIEEYGGAVAIIDPADQTFESLALPDSSIQAVAFSQDTQWLGSSNGLIRQRSGVQLRLSTDDGLPSNDVRSLLVSETTLWIGTASGLVSYDLAGETFGEPVPQFDGQVIATLFRAPDGAIWAGSRVESDDDQVLLGRYDGAEAEIWEKGDAPLPDSAGGVTAIGADAQRRVWVAVLSGGVHIWEGGTQQEWSEAGDPPRGLIYAIAPQGEGLLMGGQGDDLSNTLYQWSQAGWKPLPLDGLSSYVTAMQFTADGALWLGTGDGLLRLDPAGVAALR
jgi:ligand-binding sensor domain-containing protein